MSQSFTVGLHIDGAGSHPASWRDLPSTPEQVLGPVRLRALIARVEASGVSFATLAGAHLPPVDPSAPGRLDPLQQAAFAGPLTSRIGLIPEIPVTYLEPFHTATQLASLDYATAGRAGWLVSAENSAEAAAQFNLPVLNDADLAAEVIEVVAVNRLLWDSWEEDAVIRDLPSGRYLDRGKLHYTNFAGRSFSVKGPAITPRPPQGQLPVFAHLEHLAAAPDVALVRSGATLLTDVAQARATGVTRVFADLEIVLDARGEPGVDRLARLDAHVPWTPGTTERYVGDAAGLAARVQDLAQHVDGVRLIPASVEQDLDELRFQTLPTLIAAGTVTAASHLTLRDRLGLPATVNVYTTEGASA